MLAEQAGLVWENITANERLNLHGAAYMLRGTMGAEAHAKELAAKRGLIWDDQSPKQRQALVSDAVQALNKLGGKLDGEASAAAGGYRLAMEAMDLEWDELTDEHFLLK